MKKIYLLLCILWMGFIFYNSSATGVESNNISYNILNKVTNVNEERFKEEIIKDKNISRKINLLIRKSAHAIEFLILAILVALTMRSFVLIGREVIISTLFSVLLYAVTDEFHQLYVKGRTGKIEDIVIDFIDGIIGVVIYYLILKVRNISNCSRSSFGRTLNDQ